MTNSVPPTIDARNLLAFLGNVPYFFGKKLSDEANAVTGVEFNESTLQVEGHVTDADTEYSAMVQLRRGATGWEIDSGSCNCDNTEICSHIAALMLTSNKQAALAKTAVYREEKPVTEWSQQIDAWYQPREPRPTDGLLGSPNDPVVPMALQFLLFDAKDASQQQQWMPAGVAAQANTATRRKRFRLGVRPVVRNAEGRWVRGQLRWTTIGFKTFGWNLLRAQHHWFARFAAMARSNGQLQFKIDEDWLFLDEYYSYLLWPMLEEAKQLGIELISSRSESTVSVLSASWMDLAVSEDDEKNMSIDGVLHMGGQELVLNTDTPSGAVGDHGYYIQLNDPEQIWLAPSREKHTDVNLTWLDNHAPVHVPAKDTTDYYNSEYQRMGYFFDMRSASEELSLPNLKPPFVKASISYKIEDTDHGTRESANLGFSISYPGISDEHKPHDAEAEQRLAAIVNELFEKSTGLGNPDLSPKFYSGTDMIDFVSELVPALAGHPEIKLEETGQRPVYRQLRELPQLQINAVEHERNDWLDLGLLIKVGNHEVTFAVVIEAISNGAMKVKLPDNTWFSLDNPMFAKLKELVDEAQALNDKPKDGDLKLSVFQISLFEELDELAEGINGADLFIARMRGLLRVAEGEEAEVPAGLQATLRPYQVEGFRWLARLYRGGFGGILADDMGLGKTLQTIALVLHAHEQWDDPEACAQLPAAQQERAPFLVVAPSSVVSNWEMEVRRFAPSLKVVSIDSTLRDARQLKELAEGNDVVLTTYTLLRLNDEIYESQRFAGLILDEAQFVKNRSTKAHKAAVNLQTNFKLAVTGTPMENNLSELGALLLLTAPSLFMNITRFNRQFARPIEVLGDKETLELLQRRVKPFMLRRTKESVVLDLPAKQEQKVLVRLSEEHQHVYDTHLNRERQKILHLVEDLDKNRFTIFQSLTHLRMLALEPSLVDPELSEVPGSKLEALFDQLDDVLNEGHRALVFSQFTSYLKVLADKLTERGVKFVYLDGSTRNRASVIEQFKEGEAPLFLISLKAGGFGLNLTEADYCFLLDPWWNPAVEAQAIDRTHRIGQTRQVMVYRMIAQGTIEEKVVALQDTKRQLINTVMDEADGFAKALTAQDIRGLLE